jgi:CRISPR/Cas system-associated exonuclease Cas4 (RecB family)
LSQSSLQDYHDCPRRFQLRYVLEQPWPAVASEPLLERERYAELGRRFHQMAQRHTVGLPADQIAASASDPDLARWWRNYLNVPPRDLPSAVRRAEVTLTSRIDPKGFPNPSGLGRLTAKYDLLAFDPGRRAVIVDWKTERQRPTRAQLADRMQTRVYRYVLAEAGGALNGGQPLEPEQITLVYWFAEQPADPQVLPYDSAQHADDAAYLARLVNEIAARAEPVWPLAEDATRCRYCAYRSLCARGTVAGIADSGSDLDLDLGLDLDLNLILTLSDIEEIAY